MRDDLSEAINTFIQETADSISSSAELNFHKWQILGSFAWPNAPGFIKRKTYQSEIDYMVNWLNERFNWLDAELPKL